MKICLGAGVGHDIAFNKQQQIHILIFLLLLFPFTVKEKLNVTALSLMLHAPTSENRASM